MNTYKRNKLILPIQLSIFSFLVVMTNPTYAEYYYTCSGPPTVVERVDYYSSARPIIHKPCARHYKPRRHHLHRVRSTYTVSKYYVWPAAAPACSCAASCDSYSYSNSCCQSCRYWQEPSYVPSYVTDPEPTDFYFSSYYDMRTSDDIAIGMNIDY